MDTLLSQGIPLHILQQVVSLDLDRRIGPTYLEMSHLLSQSVLVGGKRLRPLLTFVMGELLGVSITELTPYAKSIELVHAASLAHDDVIDSATERRGQPSVNSLAGNKRAVLVGDYLLADVIIELTHLGNISILREFSLVIQQLSQGEWLQMDLIENPRLNWSLIEEIARCKTASVLTLCCTVPAIFGQHSLEVISMAQKFGDTLGRAFQYIDDTLDFDLLSFSGKNRMQDLKNGLINSVGFELLQMAPHHLDAWKRGELNCFENDQEVKKAINKVKMRVQQLITEAVETLDLICQSLGSSEDEQSIRAYQSVRFLMQLMVERNH